MSISYVGDDNVLQIGGKLDANVYGPHVRISRGSSTNTNVSIGGPIDQAYAIRVYGNLRTNGIDELSDERWKKDVVKLKMLSKVLAMKGVYYNSRQKISQKINFQISTK